MAPERLMYQNEDRGFRIQSDVFSLGLSVYNISTGTLPFPDNLDLDDLQRFYEEKEKLDIPDDETFTPEEREFLMACLEMDENKRPDYKTLLKMYFLADVKIKIFRPEFAKFVRKILEL